MNSLQLVNKVLLEMGEREVATVTETPAARKVYGMLQETVDAVNYEHSWADLTFEVLLSELSTGSSSSIFIDGVIKQLPNKYLSVERLVNVDTKTTLPFLELREFPTSTKNSIWTIWKDNLVLRTNVSLDNIALVYFGSFVLPDDQSEELPVPAYLQQLYSLRLLLKAVTRHLNNVDLAAIIFQEYTAALLSYNVVTKMLPSARESQTFNLPMFQGVSNGINTSSQRAQ